MSDKGSIKKPRDRASVSENRAQSLKESGKGKEKIFGFLDIKAQSKLLQGKGPLSNNTEFSISTPTNFQQKAHVDRDWNWSGDDVSSQFTLHEKLGSGAYGTVYRCVHNSSGTELAAKVITLSKNESIDIMKEVDVLKSCNHPNIVQYFGTCTTDSALWILMDYCGVGSLLDVLRKLSNQRLNEEQLSAVLFSVLEGLNYLHEKQIIHRDLKAGNILLTENGEVKIADFGVSAKINNKLSGSRTVIGTPLYMAPEMFDTGNYNYKADIWSLGITTIELAQGKPPRSDMPAFQVIMMISNGESPTLDSPSEYSDSLKNFISQCLEIEPVKRPEASELQKHEFVQASVTKDGQSIVQDLAASSLQPKDSPITTEVLSQGSSPHSSLETGISLPEDSKLLDDRNMPESPEELKLLVLQLRHRLKTLPQQPPKGKGGSATTPSNPNGTGNEELIGLVKKALSDLEHWRKNTKRLEDELKDILKKDKRLRETA